MILSRLYDLSLWLHPWPWPRSFKVRVWKSFISGMGRPIDNEQKYVSHPFMTNILTCVSMVGWPDVPDSDRDDFRRRRAVDISSLKHDADGLLTITQEPLGLLMYLTGKRSRRRKQTTKYRRIWFCSVVFSFVCITRLLTNSYESSNLTLLDMFSWQNADTSICPIADGVTL